MVNHPPVTVKDYLPNGRGEMVCVRAPTIQGAACVTPN